MRACIVGQQKIVCRRLRRIDCKGNACPLVSAWWRVRRYIETFVQRFQRLLDVLRSQLLTFVRSIYLVGGYLINAVQKQISAARYAFDSVVSDKVNVHIVGERTHCRPYVVRTLLVGARQVLHSAFFLIEFGYKRLYRAHFLCVQIVDTDICAKSVGYIHLLDVYIDDKRNLLRQQLRILLAFAV